MNLKKRNTAIDAAASVRKPYNKHILNVKKMSKIVHISIIQLVLLSNGSFVKILLRKHPKSICKV